MLTDTQGKRKQYWAKGWIVQSWQRWDMTPVSLWYRDCPAILLDDGTVRDATSRECRALLTVGFGYQLDPEEEA